MKFTLKRKMKKHEEKHLVKTLGCLVEGNTITIDPELGGVIRMYQQDGLI